MTGKIGAGALCWALVRACLIKGREKVAEVIVRQKMKGVRRHPARLTETLATIRRRFPEARAKTFLLSCLIADGPLEVRDPVDGDESVFQACFDHISRAVRPIVHLLAQAAP